MADIIKQAEGIVDGRMAKFIKDFEREEGIVGLPGVICRHSGGHYEGFGFRNESVCPNTVCRYYKYVGYDFSPVCAHPNVIWAVEIGGVRKCPKDSLETLLDNCIRFLKYARGIACPACYGKRRGEK